MRIILAGYNVEKDIIDKCDPRDHDILTPEIFSSAYARISRSPKDITALRRAARKDIEKSRRRNKRIIFEMGHHSVAEHAVFNFDIINVSRLALEEIEKFRLASYTEKSQRYVTLNGDFTIPEEISDEDSKKLFVDTVALQNDFYKKSFTKLHGHNLACHPERAKDKAGQKLLENLAKEDARYILSLATLGQVGTTINARNLEHLFRRFRLSKHAEVREIGSRMYRLATAIAPSVLLFPEPSQFEKDLQTSFPSLFTSEQMWPAAHTPQSLATHIVEHTEDGDDLILAAFLALEAGLPMGETRKKIAATTETQKEHIFKELFKNMEFFDSPPREFELVDITFQAVISASNFAQLKRHRMATLLNGNYDPVLGVTIPGSISAVGLEDEFKNIIDRTEDTYNKLKAVYGEAADYILTNAHRRMVVMKMNLREAYHVVRLRADAHAQWDIRSLAENLLVELKRLMPYSTMLMCGKSNYVERFRSIYGKDPQLTEW